MQDILDELDEIKIGVRYLKNGEPMKHFPSSIQVRDHPHIRGRPISTYARVTQRTQTRARGKITAPVRTY